MSTAANQAACVFDWCEFGGTCTGEHWTAIYMSATHPAHAKRVIGRGVSWYEPEDGPHPAVAVHVHSPSFSADVDAHLCLDEALELRALLDRAINIATEICGRVDR